MLIEGVHYLRLDTGGMRGHGTPFDEGALEALLGSVTDEAVLRLLEQRPLASLTLNANPGGVPGTHHHGHVTINTAPRPVTTLNITHAYAETDAQYYALVLLHEIAHALANTLVHGEVFATFYKVFQQGGGVTRYALDGCGEGRTLSEYFAETFTAAVALPELHGEDEAGVKAVQGLLAGVKAQAPT